MRLAIGGIEGRCPLEMLDGVVETSEPAVHLRGEPMTLYVLRVDAENGVDLAQGLGEVLPAHERLGQDEPGRRVVGMATETLSGSGDGLVHAARLAVEVCEEGEAQGRGILRKSLLVTADCRRECEVLRRHRRAGRLVGHRGSSTIDSSAARTSRGGTS